MFAQKIEVSRAYVLSVIIVGVCALAGMIACECLTQWETRSLRVRIQELNRDIRMMDAVIQDQFTEIAEMREKVR